MSKPEIDLGITDITVDDAERHEDKVHAMQCPDCKKDIYGVMIGSKTILIEKEVHRVVIFSAGRVEPHSGSLIHICSK